MSLKIKGLFLRQGDFELGPLDLDVGPREHLLIVGSSGSGKTTLLRAIAGLVAPETGWIVFGERAFGGEGVFLPPDRRGVGMVFQDLALWPHLNARQHLELVLYYRGAKDGEAVAQAEEGLRSVHLADRAERKPGELSGGEAQRLALARALVSRPQLLLLDEPLGQLDPHLRGEVAALIDRIHAERGLPILHVSHNLLDLAAWKGRIALMRAGRIEQTGTLQELIEHPLTPFVRQFLSPLLEMRRTLRFLDREAL